MHENLSDVKEDNKTNEDVNSYNIQIYNNIVIAEQA